MRLFLFALLLLSAGCRREDIRTMTVVMPQLQASDCATVEAALAKYRGVKASSYHWDLDKKTLTLSYDSMKVAQSNIRYAIDEKGIPVEFPKKETDRAGH